MMMSVFYVMMSQKSYLRMEKKKEKKNMYKKNLYFHVLPFHQQAFVGKIVQSGKVGETLQEVVSVVKRLMCLNHPVHFEEVKQGMWLVEVGKKLKVEVEMEHSQIEYRDGEGMRKSKQHEAE